MDSLTDVYDDRRRATGLQRLVPERLRRDRMGTLAEGERSSVWSWPRTRDAGSWIEWVWFGSPSVRQYVVGVLLWAGILLDTVTTEVLLMNGVVIEGNPLLRTVYPVTGIVGVVGVKVIVIALGVTILRLSLPRAWAETMMVWFYGICGVGWLLGGLWNLLLATLFLGG